MEDNVYENEQTVAQYANKPFLFKAEKLLIDKNKKSWLDKIFVDIGVGAGRTTGFIAPFCRQYLAIDYSQAMIKSTEKLFSHFSNAQFYYADAAKMDFIENNQIDVVLFSFNGIDSVDAAHRAKILQEIKRILKPGAMFLFSFHNTGNIKQLYSFQWPKNPFKYPKEWQRKQKIKLINGDINQYINQDLAILNDGANDFLSPILYIKPSLQLEQLKDLNFINFEAYDAQNGKKLNLSTIDSNTCPWIYLSCTSL